MIYAANILLKFGAKNVLLKGFGKSNNIRYSFKIKKSCELGIKYVNQAIGSNPNYGKGNGPINHLNSIIIKKNLNNEKYSCCRFAVGR